MKQIAVICLLLSHWAQAQVPKVGTATKTEIACWNAEWFGNTQFGPTDEALQYANVKNVLQSTDIDIWGLCEVSNPTTFSSLMAELPQYSSLLAGFSQTQKTALVWKKDLFRRVTSQLILSSNSSVFANGRLPLEVTLVSDSLNHFDTLIVIVLHMKANTGTDSEKLQSYYDRRAAGVALKTYLDQNRAGQKVAVIGDWNDMLTKSIWKDSLTPYKNFLDDPSRYFFTTLQRNQNGETSLTGFNSFIDHIMVSDRLRKQYETGSAKELNLTNYITNYSNTTSDHYPVYSYYYFGMGTGINQPEWADAIHIYPNPTNQTCVIEAGLLDIISITVSDMYGKESALHPTNQQWILDKAQLGKGTFWLRIQSTQGTTVKRVVIF